MSTFGRILVAIALFIVLSTVLAFGFSFPAGIVGGLPVDVRLPGRSRHIINWTPDSLS